MESVIAGRISIKIERELCELVPRFLANCARDAEILASAVAQSDLDTARKIGHSLKGVGGGYGFDEITRLGATIEDAAKAGDTAAALAAVDELRSYLKAVHVEYV
jgi:HPt (histidine-containing phosphotransfer) domain-containing protein